jgi:hypothetical protein
MTRSKITEAAAIIGQLGGKVGKGPVKARPSDVARRETMTKQKPSTTTLALVREWRAWKYWEIIADNLKKAGWSLGWVSAVDSERRTIWIADAHRGDGKRFVVHAEEKLTAFVELESATRAAL